MIVEKIAELLRARIAQDEATEALLRPILDGLVEHQEVLHDLPHDLWLEILLHVQRDNLRMAYRAYVRGLDPEGKIEELKKIGELYSAEREKRDKAWATVEAIAKEILSNAIDLLVLSLS